MANGQRIRLSVHQTITVNDLLALMRKLVGHQDSVKDWICLNDQTVLDANKTLAECDVKEGMRLTYGLSS